MKRIVTIQDISCIGRCSLTAALPVISCMGVETCVIPTAVLSNHTAFPGFTFRNLTDEIGKISDEWKRQDLHFDAIYTGYLGSADQIRIVEDFITRFKDENTLVIVDPAMADFGVLDKGFDADFVAAMRELCRKADIIVPNITEAAFLLDEPYHDPWEKRDGKADFRMTPEESETATLHIRELLRRLTGLGAGKAVLTGVRNAEGRIGSAAFDLQTEMFYEHFAAFYPMHFHGTGDLYASVLTGAMTRGLALSEAMGLAVDFIAECARITLRDPDRRWYGVNFEEAIPYLVDRLRAIQEDPDSPILRYGI
ncbi:MAG: pyridoxamine kinase [Lachnospiraceae bacterium]|nr:pyridoxamine kinase [Lachnospiraceae bacterium]